MDPEHNKQNHEPQPVISDEAVITYNPNYQPTPDSEPTSAPTTTASDKPVITDEAVIIYNPHYKPERSETQSTVEVQPKPKELAETGAGDLPVLGVIGGAALALGMEASAIKHRKNRRAS